MYCSSDPESRDGSSCKKCKTTDQPHPEREVKSGQRIPVSITRIRVTGLSDAETVEKSGVSTPQEPLQLIEHPEPLSAVVTL